MIFDFGIVKTRVFMLTANYQGWFYFGFGIRVLGFMECARL